VKLIGDSNFEDRIIFQVEKGISGVILFHAWQTVVGQHLRLRGLSPDGSQECNFQRSRTACYWPIHTDSGQFIRSATNCASSISASSHTLLNCKLNRKCTITWDEPNYGSIDRLTDSMLQEGHLDGHSALQTSRRLKLSVLEFQPCTAFFL
jgi:hypothetical protein